MSGYISISSRQNTYIRHAVKLAQSRAYRRESNQFTAAGDKLLHEALNCGLKISLFITCRTDKFPDPSFAERALLISESLMSAISPLDDAPDVLFCAQIPELGDIEHILRKGFSVLLDCIQDPGNVGTILRTADAFGAQGVLRLPDCADIWSPKALRSSMGAAFRLPVCETTLDELPLSLAKTGVTSVGTALADNSKNILDMDLPLNRALIAFGNEGHGLSDDVLELCDYTMRIPMSGETESLNVAQAAAVVLWEAQRRNK